MPQLNDLTILKSYRKGQLGELTPYPKENTTHIRHGKLCLQIVTFKVSFGV